MSNNIIDAVTQTVNSLVSALKLPDESAKANDTLGSMNFPQFSRILPYKDYDSATGLFINNKTVGFMFEARPLPGADKSIVATLEHLLRSKLPRGVPVSFHLVSSKLVGNDIDYGLREFRWSGKQAKKFNAINEKLYRWLRYNGEKVIDEMTCELDALSAVRQTNRDSYRRQLYLFDCLSLMVWAGMEGAEDSTREKVRNKIDALRLVLREKTDE